MPSEPVILPEATESLRQAVYEAVGHASVACWETVGTGVFQEQVAREISDNLIDQITAITDFRSPKLGLASTAELREELEVRERLMREHGFPENTGMEPALPVWRIVEEPWVGKETLWQHRDSPTIFSTDRGETYYNLEETLDPEGNPRIHRIGDQVA